MTSRACALALYTLVVPAAVYALGDGEPRSSYRIEVALQHPAGALNGHAHISYRNTTTAPLRELFFHLYANAYQPGSAFARDRHNVPFYGDPLGEVPDAANPGAMSIRAVSSISAPLQFHVDGTVLRVVLAEPLQPDTRAELDITFDVAIPDFRDRFGRRGANYAIAGWFPRLAMLDDKGWHNAQFRGMGEFYSEPANYDVTITTPARFVVGATGELVGTADAAAARTTQWRARGVRDFAWVADPNYRSMERSANGINVRYLYLERDSAFARKGLQYAVDALAFFGARYGAYPYSNFTVTESPAIGSGLGVEYPQIVMISLDLHRSPLYANAYEETVVHEVAHQWWYGLIGNDEAEEAWLDEGFASYSTRQYMNGRHGDDMPLFRWPRRLAFMPSPSKNALERAMYANQARAGFDRPVVQPAMAFDEIQSYVIGVYYKASYVLDMLEYLLGSDEFARVLRAYSEQFSNRNATTADFIAVAQSVTRRDLTEFFRQWLHSTETCDYGIDDVSARQISQSEHRTIISLRRHGTITMPVQLRVTLSDGSVLAKEWKGEGDTSAVEVVSTAPVRSVELDPDHRLLETNRVNNHHPRKLALSFNPLVWNEDSYSITHLPYVWFDDGLELGGYLLGGYPGTASFPQGVRRPSEFRLALAHNFGTERTRVSGFFGGPLRTLGPRTSWGISAAYRPGRTRAELETRFIRGAHLYRAPYHSVGVSLLHDEWTDRNRCGDVPCDEGAARRMRLSYGFNHLTSDYYPLRGGAWEVALDASPAWLGDWAFARASGSAQAYLRVPGGLLAFNLQHASASRGAPVQELPSLRYDAGFHSARFKGIVAEHVTSAHAELRLPLGPASGTGLALFGKIAHSQRSNSGMPWSSESGAGLRLFGNAPFAMQLDVPLAVTGVSGDTKWGYHGFVLRSGRPFRGRSRD